MTDAICPKCNRRMTLLDTFDGVSREDAEPSEWVYQCPHCGRQAQGSDVERGLELPHEHE